MKCYVVNSYGKQCQRSALKNFPIAVCSTHWKRWARETWKKDKIFVLENSRYEFTSFVPKDITLTLSPSGSIKIFNTTTNMEELLVLADQMGEKGHTEFSRIVGELTRIQSEIKDLIKKESPFISKYLISETWRMLSES